MVVGLLKICENTENRLIIKTPIEMDNSLPNFDGRKNNRNLSVFVQKL